MNFYEKYQNEPEMLVIRANREGKLSLLTEIFLKKNLLNILNITETERWNWLHRCNLLNPCPVEVVEFYIKHGVPINVQDCYGMTPLHYAMRAKNADGAIALLKAGADPNIPNRDNLIPLRMSIRYPFRLDLLELMLKNGGNVHYYNGKDYLLEALKDFKGSNPEYKEYFDLMDRYS